MTPAKADLARKLVALPGWEWRQGLVLTTPGYGTDVVQAVDGDGNPSVYGYNPACGDDLLRGVCADLDDPAPEELAETGDTLVDLTHDGNGGILLGMLRAAAPGRVGVEWRPEGTPRIIIAQRDQRAKWGGPMSEVEGATLSEAVAGALIAVGRCA